MKPALEMISRKEAGKMSTYVIWGGGGWGEPVETTVACDKWKIGRCTQFISAARQIHLREKC